MTEIERVGLLRDLPVGERAPESKLYFAPKEGELSGPALGTDVLGEWEWIVVGGHFVLMQRV